MIFIEYAVAVILSVLLAGGAVWYKEFYIENEKNQIVPLLKRRKKSFIIILSVYIVMAVMMISVYQKKMITVPVMIQSILLWDGLFLISEIDLKLKKIPNKILLILFILRCLGIIIETIFEKDGILGKFVFSSVGMITGAIVLLICMFISRGGVGAGDVKLYAVIGFYFGLVGIIQIMMYSLFLAAIFSIFMLIGKKAKMKSTLPMAPFICAGLTVYYIFL